MIHNLYSHFSPAVANEANRQMFTDNILSVYRKFDLDGIDIDWEYPGRQGASGNEINGDDSMNLLLFFQLLRRKLPAGAKISAAVQTVPFVDAMTQPLTNVSGFAAALDWILLMNYDVWGGERSDTAIECKV